MIRYQNIFYGVCLLSGSLFSTHVLAHAGILPAGGLTTRHNDVQGGNILKIAPCGGGAAKAPSLQLTGDSMFSLTIRESIQHNGYFAIEWADKANPSSNADFVVLNNVLDNINTGTKAASFKVPNKDCTHCVIRVIQWMTNAALDQALMDKLNSNDAAIRAMGAADPRIANKTAYYSCSDISVKAAAVPVVNPSPSVEAGTTTPVPSPVVDSGNKGGSLSREDTASDCN